MSSKSAAAEQHAVADEIAHGGRSGQLTAALQPFHQPVEVGRLGQQVEVDPGGHGRDRRRRRRHRPGTAVDAPRRSSTTTVGTPTWARKSGDSDRSQKFIMLSSMSLLTSPVDRVVAGSELELGAGQVRPVPSRLEEQKEPGVVDQVGPDGVVADHAVDPEIGQPARRALPPNATGSRATRWPRPTGRCGRPRPPGPSPRRSTRRRRPARR